MTTTTSFSNRERIMAVIRQDIRRMWGMATFYAALSFVFFPLQYFLEISKRASSHYYSTYNFYNLYGSVELYNVMSYLFFFPLMIIATIIVATRLLGYMQNKSAVDVYHQLPATRRQMMIAHFGAGMLILGAPLTLNFLMVFAMRVMTFGFGGLGYFFAEYLSWMVTVFSVFGISCFATVGVGTRGDSTLFSFVLNGVVPTLFVVIVGTFEAFVYGFSSSLLMQDVLTKLSPMLLMIVRQYSGTATEEGAAQLAACNFWFFVWFVISAAVMAATVLLYERRKSEMAESTATGGPLKLVVKLATTFTGAVLFGFIFQGLFGGYGYYSNNTDYGFFYFGTALGSAITFMLMEVILARGFKTVRKNLLPGLCAILLMLGYSFMVIEGHGFGYVTRLAEPGAVASVTVDGVERSVKQLYSVEPKNDSVSRYYVDNTPTVFESEEAIELVTRIHRLQVEGYLRERAGESSGNNQYGNFSMNYKLKNGASFGRSYSYMSSEARELLAKLQNCTELTTKYNPVFRARPQDIYSITLYDMAGDNTQNLLLLPDDVQALLEAMGADLLAQDIDAIKAHTGPAQAVLELRFKDLEFDRDYKYGSYAFLLESYSQHTLQFLRSRGTELPAVPTADMFDCVMVESSTVSTYDNLIMRQQIPWHVGSGQYDRYDSWESSRAGGRNYMSESGDMIAYLLGNSVSKAVLTQDYRMVHFYLPEEDAPLLTLYIPQSKLPQEVLSYNRDEAWEYGDKLPETFEVYPYGAESNVQQNAT